MHKQGSSLDNPLSQLFPSTSSKYITVAGSKMHYLDCGKGPVIVLLHGNPTWSFYYRNLIKTLEDKFRVIAPDHIGFGLSDKPIRKLGVAAHAKHIKELLHKLNIEKYSLVMHDWGGPIGSWLAFDNPESIQSLVYLNTTLTEIESLPWFIKTAAMPGLNWLICQQTSLFVYLTTRFGSVHILPDSIQAAYHFPFSGAKNRRAIRDFVSEIPFAASHPNRDLLVKFKGITKQLQSIPVKIVWGMKDPCFHRKMLLDLKQHFPQADVTEIQDASHLVLEDSPQIASADIRLFLIKVQEEINSKEALSKHKVSTLYSHFLDVVQKYPNHPAVIVPKPTFNTLKYSSVSYAELSALCNKYQRGLAQLGLKYGERVLMLVSPGVNFLALTYAVLGRGAVPVFLDPGMGRKQLLNCIEECKAHAMIGIPKAHLLRLIRPYLFKRMKFALVASDKPFWGLSSLHHFKKLSDAPIAQHKATDTALIAFTSGATGSPKGVIFTQEMLHSQLKIFSEAFEVKPGAKDLPLLPVFSLFSLALGICSVFPPMDTAKPLNINPELIVRIISELNINCSFGSPTLWHKIANYCNQQEISLNKMEKIFMAGAPVAENILELVQSAVPNGEAFTPYGATEALPVAITSATQILKTKHIAATSGELGTFLGSTIPGIELRIIEAHDGPINTINGTKQLPSLTIGEIIVAGSNISRNYLHRVEADKLNKIKDGQNFWHRMGDLGYLDKDDNLYFCGRKAHAVKLPEGNFCSIPIERIFNQHPKVKRSALIPHHDSVAIVIQPEKGSFPLTKKGRLQFIAELQMLSSANPLTSKISKIFFRQHFPLDPRHNAKILREQIANWAGSRKGYDI